MTVAVDTIARELFLAKQMPWRRKRGQAAWEELPPFTRYQHRAAAGEMILPTLTALPEPETPTERPVFTLGQLMEAAELGARGLADQRKPGSWDAMAEKKKLRLARLTALLTQRALAAMPPRQPPAGSTGD